MNSLMIQAGKTFDLKRSGQLAARPAFPCLNFAQSLSVLPFGRMSRRVNGSGAYWTAAMILGAAFPAFAVSGECKEDTAPVPPEPKNDSFFLTLKVDWSDALSSPLLTGGKIELADETCVCVKFNGNFELPLSSMVIDSDGARDLFISVTAVWPPVNTVSLCVPCESSRRGKSCRIGVGRLICINNHQFNL